MKIIKFQILILLIASIALSFNSCKKSEDSNPSNPTNGKSTAAFNPNVTYGTMTDQEGNVYKTITFGSKKSTYGTQTWMAENLRTTKYRNGEIIVVVPDKQSWTAATSGYYCNYNNSINMDTIATFGRLYNWFAVTDSRNIAPEGWHVPSDAEWTILTTYLGGETVAGAKMKETGTTHWESLNTATNECGFTAVPSGSRGGSVGAYFNAMKTSCYWWSSTQNDATSAWIRTLFYADANCKRYSSIKQYGFSLRCIKD